MKGKMKKNEEKIEFFWKITNYINKKHCKGKLIVKKILVSKKSRGKGVLGCYSTKKKNIWIKEGLGPVFSIKVLLHELAHAYQMSFYDKQYGRWVDFNKKEVGGIDSRQHNEIMHDVIFSHIADKFVKSVEDKICLDLKD